MNKTNYKELFGSIDEASFLAHYWQKQHCYVPRNNSAFYNALPGFDTTRSILREFGGNDDFVVSVIGGMPKQEGPNKTPKDRSSLSYDHIMQAFESGATIRIGNIAKHDKTVENLQQYFEAMLHTDINCNLYLTPPRSRAFGAHYDDHDVFIIQLEGSKCWNLRTPGVASPVEVLHRGRQRWLHKELPDRSNFRELPLHREEFQFQLQAGDLLYVPRGVVHEVFTEEEMSLHITVAAPVITWYEVVIHGLLKILPQSEALRTALPSNFASDAFDKDAFYSQMAAVRADLKAYLTEEVMHQSIEEMAKQFLISRRRNAIVAQPQSELSLDSRLRIKEHMSFRMEEGLTSFTLYFFGGHLSFPVRAESMMRYIFENKEFFVRDLPTNLSDASRITLSKKLLNEGFLEFSE
ncbi:MAG: cupin domain-containing protein [Bacteroidota bacterium]